MGKNHNSVVVLWIWRKFWWMIPMGAGQSRQVWARNSIVAAANKCRKWRTLVSKSVKNGQKGALLGAIWVPRMSHGEVSIGRVDGDGVREISKPPVDKNLESAGVLFGEGDGT